jgi:hypothetical protein
MVRWTLEWLERELHGEVSQLHYAFNIALLDYALNQKTFDLHFDQVQELQTLFYRYKLPWLKIKEGPSRQVIEQMSQQWKQVFGDPADPEVAKKIEQTVAALQANVARSRQET